MYGAGRSRWGSWGPPAHARSPEPPETAATLAGRSSVNHWSQGRDTALDSAKPVFTESEMLLKFSSRVVTPSSRAAACCKHEPRMTATMLATGTGLENYPRLCVGGLGGLV